MFHLEGDLFVDLAASLERARFDYLLVEDTRMVDDACGHSMETTLKYGLLAPKCDPVPLIPLLTQRTKHIGIAVTLSTSFYHPFMAARTMTTLDHLTDGRVGLNVVTGSSSRAAQQYGYDELMLHSERYEMAKEWMEAVGALWDSWEEGAVLVDEETPRYADHTKVHTVDFEGKYFRTRGPLNTIPGPQRRPVIVQAGASPAGRDLAAKYAESMLAHGTSIEGMKAFRLDMHRRMREYGRDPGTLKILFLIDPILGDTDRVAQAREEDMKAARFSDDAIEKALWGLSYTSGGEFDFSTFDLDKEVPDVFDTTHPHNIPSGPQWDRRAFLKAGGITVGGISLASLIAACGGAPSGGGSGGTLVLRMPFLADMQVPDPDIMYEGEGVQVRTMPVAEEFDLANQPPEKRPDMLVSFLGGDALHLDTTFRILLRTGAKPLNFYQYSNPELDSLMDEAVKQTTWPQAEQIYQKCSQMIVDEAIWIPLCVPPNSTIAQSCVTGVEDNSFYAPIFWPQALKRA